MMTERKTHLPFSTFLSFAISMFNVSESTLMKVLPLACDGGQSTGSKVYEVPQKYEVYQWRQIAGDRGAKNQWSK